MLLYMLNVKLTNTDGILEAKKIKTLADEACLHYIIDCMVESPLGMIVISSFALTKKL